LEDNYKKIDILNDEGEIIITSYNIHALDSRIILLGDNLELIAHQKEIKVCGYLEDGFVQMNGIVTLSTTSQLNFDILEIDTKKDRREYLKINSYFKMKVVRAYALGKSNHSIIHNDIVIARDISLGGIGFYSNKVFFKNQKLKVDLSYLKTNFVADLLVLRREPQQKSVGFKYKYGSKFLNLGYEQQRTICEYVFKVQIVNHKLKNNLE